MMYGRCNLDFNDSGQVSHRTSLLGEIVLLLVAKEWARQFGKIEELLRDCKATRRVAQTETKYVLSDEIVIGACPR